MTATAPAGMEQLADQVARCIGADDIRSGLAACQKLNQHYPDYPLGWYLASVLMRKARNLTGALTTIDRALQLSRSDKFQLHKAQCLFDAGDISGAAAAASVLKDKSYGDAHLHNETGALFHLLHDHSSALVHYSRAIELDSSHAELHFNKGLVQRYLGDAAGAEASFEKAIALKPDEFEAYNARANLRRQTTSHNHIAQLKDLLARTTVPAGVTQLSYALAKEQEDTGDYDSAFASLTQGARSRRQHMQYRVDTDVQIMAKICETYGPDMFAGHTSGCESPDPIFILGMPRTGTTLVERILTSHSAVYSAGELNNFSLELIRLVRESGQPAPASRTDFVARTADLDFRALGEAYLASTRALRDGSPLFIDKLPFNFLYAGLIHLALPQAKIINLQRHPMDTCYAVYKQLFRDAYPFSYDLDDLGQYYVAYHRLMQHWNRVMPGVICTIRYEAVVEDIEGEVRRLLEYGGLPWEDQCLRFYQNAQPSRTASALQVREPIYSSSVGKWRHYARQLEPLRAYLEGAGIDTT